MILRDCAKSRVVIDDYTNFVFLSSLCCFVPFLFKIRSGPRFPFVRFAHFHGR